MHQHYAEQIRFSVFKGIGTKQHHSKEKWNQCVILTHLSPQGSQEATSRRQWWCVYWSVCDGVQIICPPLVTCPLCVFSEQHTCRMLCKCKHAGWFDIQYMCCEYTLLYVNSWPGSGIIVTGTCVRFPHKGVFREAVWTLWSMCDTSSIPLDRQSVNSLWMTSSGQTNWPPSLIMSQCGHQCRLIRRQHRKTVQLLLTIAFKMILMPYNY